MQYFIFLFGNEDEEESVTYPAICGGGLHVKAFTLSKCKSHLV